MKTIKNTVLATILRVRLVIIRAILEVQYRISCVKQHTTRLLTSNAGESEWTNSAIKVIIGVVIGAIILGAMIVIIGKADASTGLMKTIKDKIEALFNMA